MSKTELWDRLGKTDPSQTKAFQRAGGFKGTAVKPIWSIHQMTKEFGPCGVGWGINEPVFQAVPAEGEILVYCTVSIWHGARENTVFGVGGDKVLGKNRNGSFTDDEAFKKAFTDAITNAMKMIGVAADIHSGKFEDSKYVAELKAEFAEEQTPPPQKRQNPHVTQPADIADHTEQDVLPRPTIDVPPLSKARANPIFKKLQDTLWACGTVSEMEAWSIRNKDDISKQPDDWYKILRSLYVEHKAEIIKLETADDNRMAG